MKRPLVCFTIAMVMGVFIGNAIGSITSVLATIAIVLLIIIVSVKKAFLTGHLATGILIFFSIGCIQYFYVYNKNIDKLSEFQGKQTLIRGEIDSSPEIRDIKTVYILKIREIELDHKIHRVNAKVSVSLIKKDQNFSMSYGDKIEIDGNIVTPKGKTNPGGFDYKKYLARKGVSGSLFATKASIKILEKNKCGFLFKLGENLRNRVINVINKSLPKEQAGLLNGMLIGYREGLTREAEEFFSNSGLTHIMAVSGANVAFIIFPLVFIFNKFGMRQRVYNSIIIGILCLFVLVTGFEPSILRAVIMAITILIGQILYRETDIYTSIAFSCMVLLLYNPCNLFNIGFQLSFAATIALVIFYKNIKSMLHVKKIPNVLSDVLASTLAAQIGVIPITLYFFNKVSLISILSNLIVIPFTTIITILGFMMAILGQVSICLSGLLGYINYIFLYIVLFTAKKTAEIPYATITLSTPSIISIIAYYICMVYFLCYRPLNKKKTVNLKFCTAVCLCIVIVAILKVFMPHNLEVTFLDVGQGDSTFIKTPSGKTILIDGGGFSGSDSDMGKTVIIPYLLDRGVSKINLIFATHGHDDHIQGIKSVLQNIQVGSLIIPEVLNKEQFDTILTVAAKNGVDVIETKGNDIINIDEEVSFKTLYPRQGRLLNESNYNNNSLVLKLIYKDVSMLFTGDIEKEVEEILVGSKDDLKSDVLKVPHHGSITSSTKEFIEKVNPSIAVIQVGINNFGHPANIVLERYINHAVKIFRNDIDGAVFINTDGKILRVNRYIYN